MSLACNKPLESSSSTNKVESQSPLLGAWEMQDFYWIGKDTTYANKGAQVGIFYFTPYRYGIMWTPNTEPRTSFVNLSKPTDEECIAGFKSVVFNGGTYTMTDSTITTTATIAKVPGFEGGKQFYRYSIDKDQLTITMVDETYPNGEKPTWSGKWKTQFVMKKAK